MSLSHPQQGDLLLVGPSVQQIYLVDVSLACGIDGLMQLGHVHFNIFAAKCAATLGEVLAGLWWAMNNDQLSWLHLINDLFDGVPVRATFVVDVCNSGSVIRYDYPT